jgi:hypothetical protein
MAYNTVREFKEELDKLIAERPDILDQELRIPCERRFSAVGGWPTIKIENMACGFDWDHGIFFLNPEKRIHCEFEELLKGQRALENIALCVKLDYEKVPPKELLKTIKMYVDNYVDKK